MSATKTKDDILRVFITNPGRSISFDEIASRTGVAATEVPSLIRAMREEKGDIMPLFDVEEAAIITGIDWAAAQAFIAGGGFENAAKSQPGITNINISGNNNQVINAPDQSSSSSLSIGNTNLSSKIPIQTPTNEATNRPNKSLGTRMLIWLASIAGSVIAMYIAWRLKIGG